MSSQISTDTHEFPAAEPVTVILRVGSGSVSVAAEDRDVVTVSVTPYDDSDASRSTANDTHVSFSSGKLRIETPDSGRLFRRGGRVRVDLTVPTNSRLQAQVGSADVRTEGRLAEVGVTSGSGDLYVSETTGTLRAETGSGDVRAELVGGELRANTGSGDISATTVLGTAVVKAASGDIDLDATEGEVRAMTASGDIQIGAARGGRLVLNSASGDVAIGVPVGTRVWLDLNTVSGSATSDLAAADAPADGQALSIVARTVSGDINIRRVHP